MRLLLAALQLLALPICHAVAIPSPTSGAYHDHPHDINPPLPGLWYHAEEHPVNSLFRRASNDGVTYAPVGSPTWSSAFPQSSPIPSALPAEWVGALNAAVAAGKIPNIPQSSNTPGVNPVYPPGVNPSGPEVCSATYKCRNPADIWDAPTGFFASSFDDGPLPPTTQLVQFFNSNNETTTHFMIGINIINNPQQFLAAFTSSHDIGVHTWTHPYMTTLSNLDVLGQLGWTIQLIHNSTGGRVPKYWRPPYGDSDNRVRAIAKEVFGMDTVIWNQDTGDWSLTVTGGTNPQAVQSSMQQWLTGPKSPGLIILEHELTPQSVAAFISAYPLIKGNGWNLQSLAQLYGGRAYQNAQGSSSNDVVPAGVLVAQNITTLPASSSTLSTSQTATSTSSKVSTSTASTTHSSAISIQHRLYIWQLLCLLVAILATHLA